ncbi:MAG: putative beta-lysine N-acetyltransferase [Candidatus Cloacimonetes bacterium]|nr:putative beta-lysine N-acetyltransferase [Candidatus Cloacimonadota bacterium]
MQEKQVAEVELVPDLAHPTDEWAGINPSPKEMGLVSFTLDKGVKTTVVGTVYGMDFDIEHEGYRVKAYFDHYNKRLKIVDYEAKDYRAMLLRMAWLADQNGFTKIFVKAVHEDFQQFLSHGYMMEGLIKYYFQGQDAYILSRFSSQKRVRSDSLIEEAKMVEKLVYNAPVRDPRTLPAEFRIVQAKEQDIPDLVVIYRQVFETYPSPLTNPDYIKASMERNVIYRLAYLGDRAVAAASAEMDLKHSNAEMTDCATIPEVQGKGLMQHLLMALEKDLVDYKVHSAYTLARAVSFGMNRVFFRLGYEFCGRLINNCDIFGQFEDMNIWVKRL